MSALRVAHVSFHADVAQRDAATLLAEWPTLSSVAAGVARAGAKVVVIQTAHADETVQRDGVSFHFVNDARRVPARLIRRVRDESPDVVHVHGFHHPGSVWQLSRALPHVPVMIQDHGSVPPTGWRRGAWRMALRPLAGASFTERDQAAPWIASGILRHTVPVFEVLEGSTTFTPGDCDAARRATGLTGDPCVLWTSRLNANKDPLTMLAAFEIAAAELPDARLWCCFGDAPMLDDVLDRVERSPLLRSRVTMLGARPHAELEQLYRAADFYIQTSHREAAGFSLIEALACGTTPIVTDIPPSRRIVGTAGSLTPVGDAEAMALALVDWAKRDRAALRRDARTRFESALTFDAIGRSLCSAYESLLMCAS